MLCMSGIFRRHLLGLDAHGGGSSPHALQISPLRSSICNAQRPTGCSVARENQVRPNPPGIPVCTYCWFTWAALMTREVQVGGRLVAGSSHRLTSWAADLPDVLISSLTNAPKVRCIPPPFREARRQLMRCYTTERHRERIER